MLSALPALCVSAPAVFAAAAFAGGETHPVLDRRHARDAAHLRPAGLARRRAGSRSRCATTDLEANRGAHRRVARAGRRPRTRRRAPADDARGERLEPALVAGRAARSYFLSTRGGSSQVWRIPLEGGEAEQLTELPLDVGNLAVFPDGERLLVRIDVYPDATPARDRRARRRQRAAEPRPAPGSTTRCSSATGTRGRTASAATSSSCRGGTTGGTDGERRST